MTVDELLDRGAALAERDAGQALACFEQALRLDPACAPAWVGKAGALRALGRHVEAIEAYDRALSGRPEMAELWFERADCLECVDRLDESLTSYERALQLDPTMVPALIDRGHVLNRLKRHRDAIASYERAIAIDPRAHLAWFNKAEQERIMSMIEPALRSYVHFFRTVPPGVHDNLVAHARDQVAFLVDARPSEQPEWLEAAARARELDQAGKLEEAAPLYRRAADLNPAEAPKLLHNLGVLYEQLKRPDEAIATYREALAHDGAMAWTWTQLGFQLLGKQDDAGALAAFARAVELQPDYAKGVFGLALAQQRLHRFEEALVGFKRALELDPADDAKRVTLALALHRIGRYQDAYGLVHKLPKPSGQVLWLIGSCLLAMDKPAEALRAFDAIPGDGHDGVIDRGLALERLGRKEEAIASYERGHVMSGRKWFHLARHRPEHAKDYYGRAFEALSADDRVNGLDRFKAAELAGARKKLQELDPERYAAIDAFDRERREALRNERQNA